MPVPPALTLRSVKGAVLTHNEVDANFQNIADSIVEVDNVANAAAAAAADAAADVAALDAELAALVVSNFFPGFVAPSAVAAPPTGWLLCDGAAVSRATYADLFAAIGVNYGPGDGATTFNLPDGRHRSFIGAGAAALDANRQTARVIGESGGSEKHTLLITESPAHVHEPQARVSSDINGGGPIANGLMMGDSGTGTATPQTLPSGTTSSAGGGQAHNNMPPFFVGNWIIKT
jgi:microcystin-dependent protein